MFYLFLYLGMTVIGYVVGRSLKARGIELPWVGRLQTLVIVVLVFLMGSRIGSNREIVAQLDTIGLVSFVYTLIVFAATLLTATIARRILGFDRYGVRNAGAAERKKKAPGKEKASVPAEEKAADGAQAGARDESGAPDGEESGARKLNWLTILIVVFVAIGIICGYTFLPDGFIAVTGTLLTICLCVLLVSIGIDIGTAGTLGMNFRSAGWRVLVFPFATIVGMMLGSVIAAAVLPMSTQDALCVGSGFAWYSLAPVMLAEYSTRVSAISFMHNVFREIFGILLVPVVAKRLGYIECYSLPGSTSMDVCLPVIERATSSDVAVYSFINGGIISASVPFLVTLFMSL